MDNKFSSIMELQEREDKASMTEDAFRSAVLKEFSNGNLILKQAEKMGYTVEEFMRRGAAGLNFPFLPVRTCQRFYVKKHTSSQRPYRHAHDFYEAIFVQKGKCRQMTDEGPIELESGGFCIIPPAAAHLMERSGESDVIVKMVIPESLYLKTAGAAGITEKIKTLYLSQAAKYIISALTREELNRDGLHDAAAESWLTLLFTEIARAEKHAIDSLELNLEGYINDNLKEASLEKFAEKLGYNATYMSRLIKLKTGRSFRAMLSELRMNAAEKLLSDTDMPVAQIASETGYSNPCGFYRQFIAFRGMTPSEFRKKFE